jgi:uncharacterized protein
MKKSKYTVGNYGLRVRRGVSGKGLFAKEAIPKGVCIIEYIGTPIKKEDQETATGRYLFETGRDKMINGNIKENTARYINHSCRPNCEADGPSGHVYILTLRKIKAGEELTYDYGEEYFDDYIKPIGCRCVKCKERLVRSTIQKK